MGAENRLKIEMIATKEKTALLIEMSLPSDFDLNNAEIKKMTKYQDLRNEVKRSWKRKSIKIVPELEQQE